MKRIVIAVVLLLPSLANAGICHWTVVKVAKTVSYPVRHPVKSSKAVAHAAVWVVW